MVLDRELEEEKNLGTSEPQRIRCPLCGCLPARKTSGLVTADTNGTRLIREACAQPACTNGLQHTALLAADGRRIRTGMRNRGSVMQFL